MMQHMGATAIHGLSPSSGGRIGLGLPPDQGVRGRTRIFPEGPDRGVPAHPHQHRRGRAVLGGVRELRVTELMQGERSAIEIASMVLEQLGRPPVRQPGPQRRRVDILHRHTGFGLCGRSGTPAPSPTGQQPRQQPRGPGLPRDRIPRPALAGHPGAPVRHIQVRDVEHRQLVGTGGGLVEHRPQKNPFPRGTSAASSWSTSSRVIARE